MEIPSRAAVNYGPIILLRDPNKDNPTAEMTFISLVQGQPDQTWVEGMEMEMGMEMGMGMEMSSLPLPPSPF